MILAAINTTINTSTWVAIALPAGQNCEDFVAQARTAVDVIISSVAAGTTYWTIKSGSSISINATFGPAATMFYAKALVSGAVLEVQPLRRHRNS